MSFNAFAKRADPDHQIRVYSVCKWKWYVCSYTSGPDKKWMFKHESLFIIHSGWSLLTPFNDFANRADPDQAALVRAAWSGSTLFACGNDISDPTLVYLTSNFFVLCTIMKVYLLFIVGGAFWRFCKQSRPRSGSSYKSCQIRVYSVCLWKYDISDPEK